MSVRLEKRQTESTTELQEENKEEITKVTPNNVSITEKIRILFKLITVEPALIAYLFAGEFAQTAAIYLQVEMACRVNMGLNDTLCSNYTLGLNHTRDKIIETTTWSDPTARAISGILVLCFSTFSDRYKIRKPFFVIPMFGEVLSCIGLLLCVVFVNVWPIEVYFILANIIPACFGGAQIIIVSINSYIADISTIEERTTRLGFVELVSLILAPVAPALGAILYSYFGYYGIFSICGILFLFASLYGWFNIPEKQEPIVRTKNICVDVFNIKAVVIDMVQIVIRKRIGYRRCLLLLAYICYILIEGTDAETKFFQVYLGLKFNMDAADFEYFLSFNILTYILGMLLAITIFARKLKIPDLMLVAIACCSQIIAPFWYAFVNSLIMLYIGCLIFMFSGIYILALRSLVTKLVSESEVAKAQALFAMCDIIHVLIYKVMYFEFDKAFKMQFQGSFLFLSAGLIIPPFVMALFMHAVYRNDPKDEIQITNGDSNEQGIYNEGNEIETSKL